MLHRLIQTLGIVAVTGAALLLTPALGTAQRHSSSSGGRGASHPSAASPHYGGHPNASHYETGHHEGSRGYPYGAYWGGYPRYYDGGYRGSYGYYPRYYDRSYYGTYSIPDYSVTADYYGDPSTDMAAEQTTTAVVSNFRMPAPDAELWIQGKRMEGQGLTRQFVSPPLDSDGQYTYHFEARWNENGQERKMTKTADVHAGDRITVDFSRQ